MKGEKYREIGTLTTGKEHRLKQIPGRNLIIYIKSFRIFSFTLTEAFQIEKFILEK